MRSTPHHAPRYLRGRGGYSRSQSVQHFAHFDCLGRERFEVVKTDCPDVAGDNQVVFQFGSGLESDIDEAAELLSASLSGPLNNVRGDGHRSSEELVTHAYFLYQLP